MCVKYITPFQKVAPPPAQETKEEIPPKLIEAMRRVAAEKTLRGQGRAQPGERIHTRIVTQLTLPSEIHYQGCNYRLLSIEERRDTVFINPQAPSCNFFQSVSYKPITEANFFSDSTLVRSEHMYLIGALRLYPTNGRLSKQRIEELRDSTVTISTHGRIIACIPFLYCLWNVDGGAMPTGDEGPAQWYELRLPETSCVPGESVFRATWEFLHHQESFKMTLELDGGVYEKSA